MEHGTVDYDGAGTWEYSPKRNGTSPAAKHHMINEGSFPRR